MQFRTGDINLFAACMALGIPPDPIEPAAVYQNDDGKDYISFTLDYQSLCGMHSTREMMGAWAMRAAFEREFPHHPFITLMQFSSMALGARRKADWIDAGARFLGLSYSAFARADNDIGRLEIEAPESPVSYVACFIANRHAAIGWAKNSVPKIAISKGKSMLLMDATLSAKNQRFLLSKL